MDLPYITQLTEGRGFNYDNCLRNTALLEHAGVQQTHMKTGTTICGAIFKDGIVLCTDTKASAGSLALDKQVQKLIQIAPNIWTAFCGTAADCVHIGHMVKRDLELHRLNTHTQSRVQQAAGRFVDHLFRYGGHIGVGLVLGGFDVKGPQIMHVSPDGNSFGAPFDSQGSGGLNAMAVLEREFKDNMTEQECVDMVVRAIEAGVEYDLGSGCNVDYVVIRKDGTSEFHKGHK